MIKNYMYSDAAGTDVTATDTDGYIVFAGGTSLLLPKIKTSDILEVGNFANVLVGAVASFSQAATIAGTHTEGDIATITILSPDSRQNRRSVYKVYVHTGDTATSIAAALAAQINADDTSAVASPAAGVVTITSVTEQLIITVGAQGTTTNGLGGATDLVLATTPAYFADKDSVVLGADASYAALYVQLREFQDQTYIGGGFAGEIIAIYAPTAEVDAMETVINAAL